MYVLFRYMDPWEIKHPSAIEGIYMRPNSDPSYKPHTYRPNSLNRKP